MKLTQIMQECFGLFSKDSRTRMSNGQVEINGEKITTDIDIDILLHEGQPVITDAGTFISQKIATNPIWLAQCQVFGLDALWSFDNELSKFFSDFLFIKISKREYFVIHKNHE